VKVARTAAARDDLAAIAAYLYERNPFAAENVADDIFATVGRLSDLPFRGRRQDEADVLKLVSPRDRHRIFYVIEEDAAVVTILAILHPARQA
jgi:plasmid stabilization system protein ParE